METNFFFPNQFQFLNLQNFIIIEIEFRHHNQLSGSDAVYRYYQPHFEHDIFVIGVNLFTNEFHIKNCTMSIIW